MKNKITKILGVVLTLTVLASMLVIAAPVSAGTQAWSTSTTPSTTGMVLNTSYTFAGPIAQAVPVDAASLGALYVATSADTIIKSTNGGRTWAKSGTVGQPDGAVVALVASPTEANVIFYATASSLYKSTDAGVTFNLVVSVPSTEAITALDVAKWSGRYIAVIGVDAYGPGVTMDAGVYYWDESLPFNNFTPVGTTTFGEFDVLAVAMAPTFAVDRTVIAIGSDEMGNTTVRVDVNGGAWGAIIDDTDFAVDAEAADIAFPSDFSLTSGPAYSPVYFITLADTDGAGGGAYRLIGTAPAVTPITPVAVDATADWVNLDINGAFNSGTASILLGSNVGTAKKSTNSGFSFSSVTLRSAATGSTAWVLFDKAYATNKTAYILNVGTNGAFNVTTDGMTYFNQWSLINTGFTGIRDLAIGSNGDMFMISTGDGTNTSIWRTMVSPATPWERVYYAGTTTYDMIRVPADYATSKAVFITLEGSASAIMVSTSNANKFDAMSSAPGSFTAGADVVYSLLALSATTVVVGSDDGIITTNTSAYFWKDSDVFGTGFTVTNISAAGGTNLLAVATDGAEVAVAKSADNGLTWTAITATIEVDDFQDAFVAPAADYATTGNIFVACDEGVWRYPSATNTWIDVDTDDNVDDAAGLVTAPGGPGNSDEGSGMAYVVDDDQEEFVARVRGLSTESEVLNSELTTVTADFSGLWAYPATAGNVKLFTIGDNAKLYTYTDTLGVAGTGVAVSNLATVSPTGLVALLGGASESSGTISWTALANATGYEVYVNRVAQKDFYTAVDGAEVDVVHATPTALTATVTGMLPGTTYYVSVWADAPVSSFMFGGTTSFSTPLAVPTAPGNLVPASGATNIPVNPGFEWAPVLNATGYVMEVSTSPTFASLVGSSITLAGGSTTAYTWAGTPLANGTAYYWRVRATLTGGTSSDWVTHTFTTVVAAPPVVTVTNVAPSTPTIIVTAPPAVTVTIPPQVTPIVTVPNITITQIPADTTTPPYIWIIVGVGALLTLAVIILIIRTRRVV